MERIEELKHELVKQKEAIEEKGGKVVIGGSNPSPSEITEGINSIVPFGLDLSRITATPEDVAKGKTFLNSSAEFVEGTMSGVALDMFVYNDVHPSSYDKELDFHFPDEVINVKSYQFYNVPYKMNIWLNPDTVSVGAFALSNGDITIKNFESLTKLQTAKQASFQGCKGVNLAAFPDSLENLSSACFANITSIENSIILPKYVKKMEDSAIRTETQQEFEKLVIPETVKIDTLAQSSISGYLFNSDFTLPPNIKTLAMGAFYNTSFNNVVIPSTVTDIAEMAFYTGPGKIFRTKTITFLATTPPKIGSMFFHPERTCNIYVPDNSLSEYKAALSGYDVYPISQRP